MSDQVVTPTGWERALMAAEKVKERCRRATKALDSAGISYAVVDGNAVAEWVGRVDEDAVRNTRDVNLLLRRVDLPPRKPLWTWDLSTIISSMWTHSSTVRRAN